MPEEELRAQLQSIAEKTQATPLEEEQLTPGPVLLLHTQRWSETEEQSTKSAPPPVTPGFAPLSSQTQSAITQTPLEQRTPPPPLRRIAPPDTLSVPTTWRPSPPLRLQRQRSTMRQPDSHRMPSPPLSEASQSPPE